jgi:hypothetical protein
MASMQFTRWNPGPELHPGMRGGANTRCLSFQSWKSFVMCSWPG